jgi:hypothetical protein
MFWVSVDELADRMLLDKFLSKVLDVSDVSVSTHLRLNFQTILEGDIFCFPSKFVFNGTVEIFIQTNCANRFCENESKKYHPLE